MIIRVLPPAAYVNHNLFGSDGEDLTWKQIDQLADISSPNEFNKIENEKLKEILRHIYEDDKFYSKHLQSFSLAKLKSIWISNHYNYLKEKILEYFPEHHQIFTTCGVDIKNRTPNDFDKKKRPWKNFGYMTKLELRINRLQNEMNELSNIGAVGKYITEDKYLIGSIGEIYALIYFAETKLAELKKLVQKDSTTKFSNFSKNELDMKLKQLIGKACAFGSSGKGFDILYALKNDHLYAVGLKSKGWSRPVLIEVKHRSNPRNLTLSPRKSIKATFLSELDLLTKYGSLGHRLSDLAIQYNITRMDEFRPLLTYFLQDFENNLPLVRIISEKNRGPFMQIREYDGKPVQFKVKRFKSLQKAISKYYGLIETNPDEAKSLISQYWPPLTDNNGLFDEDKFNRYQVSKGDCLRDNQIELCSNGEIITTSYKQISHSYSIYDSCGRYRTSYAPKATPVKVTSTIRKLDISISQFTSIDKFPSDGIIYLPSYRKKNKRKIPLTIIDLAFLLRNHVSIFIRFHNKSYSVLDTSYNGSHSLSEFIRVFVGNDIFLNLGTIQKKFVIFTGNSDIVSMGNNLKIRYLVDLHNPNSQVSDFLVKLGDCLPYTWNPLFRVIRDYSNMFDIIERSIRFSNNHYNEKMISLLSGLFDDLPNNITSLAELVINDRNAKLLSAIQSSLDNLLRHPTGSYLEKLNSDIINEKISKDDFVSFFPLEEYNLKALGDLSVNTPINPIIVSSDRQHFILKKYIGGGQFKTEHIPMFAEKKESDPGKTTYKFQYSTFLLSDSDMQEILDNEELCKEIGDISILLKKHRKQQNSLSNIDVVHILYENLKQSGSSSAPAERKRIIDLLAKASGKHTPFVSKKQIKFATNTGANFGIFNSHTKNLGMYIATLFSRLEMLENLHDRTTHEEFILTFMENLENIKTKTRNLNMLTNNLMNYYFDMLETSLSAELSMHQFSEENYDLLPKILADIYNESLLSKLAVQGLFWSRFYHFSRRNRIYDYSDSYIANSITSGNFGRYNGDRMTFVLHQQQFYDSLDEFGSFTNTAVVNIKGKSDNLIIDDVFDGDQSSFIYNFLQARYGDFKKSKIELAKYLKIFLNELLTLISNIDPNKISVHNYDEMIYLIRPTSIKTKNWSAIICDLQSNMKLFDTIMFSNSTKMNSFGQSQSEPNKIETTNISKFAANHKYNPLYQIMLVLESLVKDM